VTTTGASAIRSGIVAPRNPILMKIAVILVEIASVLSAIRAISVKIPMVLTKVLTVFPYIAAIIAQGLAILAYAGIVLAQGLAIARQRSGISALFIGAQGIEILATLRFGIFQRTAVLDGLAPVLPEISTIGTNILPIIPDVPIVLTQIGSVVPDVAAILANIPIILAKLARRWHGTVVSRLGMDRKNKEAAQGSGNERVTHDKAS
jgi:hypothetical protein